jgi:hypothetical protein
MKLSGKAVLGIGVTFAAIAYAAAKGDTLFVRAKNTHLKKSADATAATVAILQPGDPVSYLGPAAGGHGWHEVLAKGAEGFMYQSNLSTSKPQLELIGAQQSVSPEVFAASGAATRGLAEGAKHYGTVTQAQYAKAVKDIETVEQIAGGVTDAKLADHEVRSHLHPMVGAEAKR